MDNNTNQTPAGSQPRRWPGRKSAVAAVMAIGFSSAVAGTAVALVPAGQSSSERPGPGGGMAPQGGPPGPPGSADPAS